MRRATLKRIGVVVPILACVIGMQLSAAPLITFNEATGGSGANQNQSVGWSFNVLNSIAINALGWYDQGQDGLAVAHTVGIWNSGGTLLASMVVPNGTTGTLIGLYRTASITPITLNPGTGYVVGGENFGTSADRLASNVSQTVDPNIVYVNARFSNIGSGFVDPTQTSIATTGFYGPMAFTATVAAVPEPATLGVAGLGLLMVALVRSRRRRTGGPGRA